MHDYTEFHHQNTINKWRNRLDDIRRKPGVTC